ncbi:hypothetical protein FRB99_007972 [Tulasnella sp. 403]|nr:hypothetical protein FRB99_007972 [Tulasnella sp. 403]
MQWLGCEQWEKPPGPRIATPESRLCHLECNIAAMPQCCENSDEGWRQKEGLKGKKKIGVTCPFRPNPTFLEVCRLISISKDAAKTGDHSPTGPKFDKLDVDDDRVRLTANYPAAFTDTHGTPSGQPFVYRTGEAWSKPEGGPEAYPHVRELRPVYGHPITDSWPGILDNVKAYLGERGQAFTAIMGFGWANAGDERPVCPLLLTIGVEPKSLAFDDAKTAAHHVKSNILGQAGFSNIVAFWEFTTSFSGIGPKLRSLNPLVDRAATEFAHPYASTLGLFIAPLIKGANYEGSGGCYFLRDKDSKQVLLFTAAHVARPPSVFPGNRGLTETAARRHREDDRHARKDRHVGGEEGREALAALEAAGANDDDDITSSLQAAEQAAHNARATIQRLDRLHSHVTKFLYTPSKRRIGFNLYVDPIGVSSTAADGFTVDWAMIQLDEDAFNWDEFKGNKVYIGGNIDEGSYGDLMFPCIQDKADYSYPEDGLLQIRGVVPLSEIHRPTQRNASGDPAMPVIKKALPGVRLYD